MKKLHRAGGRQQRRPEQRSGRQLGDRPSDRFAAGHHPPRSSTTCSTMPSANARSPAPTRAVNQYYIVMEVDPQFWQSPDALKNVYVSRQRFGGMVPLSAFTHFAPSTAPMVVNHSSVFPSVTISFNLLPGVSLGNAVDLINQAAERTARMPSRTSPAPSAARRRHFGQSLANEPLLDRRRARRRLRGARNPLRELHSSHHDSVHAAVRRGGSDCWRSRLRIPT